MRWPEEEQDFALYILTVTICGLAILESAPSVEAPGGRLRPKHYDYVFRVPQYKFFAPLSVENT